MGKFFAVYCTFFALVGVCGISSGFPQPKRSEISRSVNLNHCAAALLCAARFWKCAARFQKCIGTKPNETGLPPHSAIKSTKFDDSDVYLDPDGENDQISHATNSEKSVTPAEPEGDSQTFYPSFFYNNQPLGHSRPVFFQQEAAYSQRPSGAYRQQLNYDNLKYNNPFRRDNFQVAEASQNILGSGNFGVISGGTFYNENDNDQHGQNNIGRYNYNPFFHNNGHGRPSFFFGATNPRPQQHEQFANFRDFADINTPNPAYSEYVVVYINKNGSSIEAEPRKIAEPKNIIERLEMLDQESRKSTDSSSKKKLSASKRKLALLPPEKKIRNKKTVTTTPSSDLYEPLLALS